MGFTIDISVRPEISVALYEETRALILMDTKVSAHILANKSYFTPYDSKFQPNSVRVILADDTECKNITDKGEIMLTLNTNT